MDRLRYVECMVSDDVRDMYLKSQTLLTRKDRDALSSAKLIEGFHIKIAEVFNNSDNVFISQKLPDLHKDFEMEHDLVLG